MKRTIYDFTNGPDASRASDLFDVICALCLSGARKEDKVLYCYNRELISREEAELVLAWLNPAYNGGTLWF